MPALSSSTLELDSEREVGREGVVDDGVRHVELRDASDRGTLTDTAAGNTVIQEQGRRTTTVHGVFIAAAIALALVSAAQAAPSRSSAVADVNVTTYFKAAPIGVTVRSHQALLARQVCKGVASTSFFTPCRTGGSRYRATACAWRVTHSNNGTSAVISVTMSRAALAVFRPTVCPAVAQAIRGTPGFRIVRLK